MPRLLYYHRMPRDNILMVADSQSDADMLYAIGYLVEDSLIFLQSNGKSTAVVEELELLRARSKAKKCNIQSLQRLQRKLRKNGNPTPSMADVISHLLKQNRVKKVSVPPCFPHGLALELKRKNIKVKLCKEPVFSCRSIKTKDEVKKISAALIMAEVGLAEGLQALKSTKIAKNGNLLFHSAPLTSEKLRSIIDIAILKAGGSALHTIVAGGLQACDPYEEGSGVLHANKPIIIDIFPRSQQTGYFGDITRTVVKGRASEAVRKMYHTVAKAQAAAFEKMRDNTPAAEVHRTVEDFFENQGYKSGENNGRMEGFFHGTGHGVGLELHEAPCVGSHSQDILVAGNVATVEPGLYYSEIGAVRLEDVVHITRHTPKNLTQFEKVLEIN